MKHKYIQHKHCEEDNCYICHGGLSVCSICGCAEGGLTSECSNINCKQIEDLIYIGHIDFKDNKWISKKTNIILNEDELKFIKENNIKFKIMEKERDDQRAV